MISQETIVSAVGLVLHASVIVVVLAKERRQPSTTMAWLLALVFLPAVGLVLYLVFGTTRSRRAAERISARSARVGAILDKHSVHHKLRRGDDDGMDPRIESMLALGRKLASTPPSLGNRADILVDGRATYDAMIEAVEGARDHVHVEFYIIQADETGRALRDALVSAAGRGVEVRVLCDAIGSFYLPGDFWRPLEAVGGEAAAFGPMRRVIRLLQGRDRFDFRNHRKIVVVDGRIGFTGGINVGREYLGLDPARGSWRDTHVRLRGPATLALQKAFAEDWLSATEKLLDDERYFPEPEALDGASAVQIVDSGPDRSWSPIALFHVQAFALAQRRLWLTSPYFVPSPSILDGLLTAALRGVDVRLLVPDKPDHRLVGLASRSYYAVLREAGVRIFRYHRGFVHAKTMVVDEWIGSVGSANIDIRSFHLNFELNAFVYGNAFVNELAGHFEQDLEHAREVGDEETELSFVMMTACGMARLLSPLL
ncbi:MAG: cardiolipin synthase [Planctomycetes bacterium]|nr:cardiolipin synthase [Planctomycetota bacterium]